MNSTRRLVIAASLILSGQMASAQDMARYRAYALESNVASVIAASGARSADAKTIHKRPATIQELQWRAPYVTSTDTMADPVRDIAFTFYNDALYQVVVNYDRARTEGLTRQRHPRRPFGDVWRARAAIGRRRGRPPGRRILRQHRSRTVGDCRVVDDAPPWAVPSRIPADPAFETVGRACPERDPGGGQAGCDRCTTPRIRTAQKGSWRRHRRSRPDAHH